jgi:hypothetical protein
VQRTTAKNAGLCNFIKKLLYMWARQLHGTEVVERPGAVSCKVGHVLLLLISAGFSYGSELPLIGYGSDLVQL